MKFEVDEWVLYCPLPDALNGTLKEERIRSVILDILTEDQFYDYKIFIDGRGTVKKVREQQLFILSGSTY